MESEELKKTWSSLDARLRRQEILNTAIVKENLTGKSDKRLGRMINYSYFGLTVVTLLLAVVINALVHLNEPYIVTIAWVIILFLLFTVATGIIGLVKLQKINFSSPVSESIRHMRDYCVWYRKLYITACICCGILAAGILVAVMIFENLPAWKWSSVAGALGGGIVACWWEYKRMFRKNTDSILKNLEELKALESE